MLQCIVDSFSEEDLAVIQAAAHTVEWECPDKPGDEEEEPTMEEEDEIEELEGEIEKRRWGPKPNGGNGQGRPGNGPEDIHSLCHC